MPETEAWKQISSASEPIVGCRGCHHLAARNRKLRLALEECQRWLGRNISAEHLKRVREMMEEVLQYAELYLRFPHGLGDCCQFSAVLKHLRKHRPDWEIDIRVGRGKHTALLGLCHKVFHDQEPEPPKENYDSVGDIGYYENFNCYEDRPCSKNTNCLAEVFGIPWDPECNRYQINLSASTRARAAEYLRSIGAQGQGEKFNTVIVHYAGNTSPWKKNLKHWQAQCFFDLIIRAGRVPILFDWDNRCPLADQKTIFCPRADNPIWGSFGSGDAEMIASLIHLSEAFIGIDSGPGKAASATNTPSLICWVKHSPVQFHDPAENTTHLVPGDWTSITPCNHPGVARFFREHYIYRCYHGDYGLVTAAREWLSEVLHFEDKTKGMNGDTTPFVLPNGIGDVTWALTKIRAIAGTKPIDIILSGDPRREVDQRSVPFVKRFEWVRSCVVLDIPHLESEDDKTDAKGRYRYVPDGPREGFHFLMPNRPLEHGQRLEEWLPGVPIDWKVMDSFDWANTERGTEFGRSLNPFVAFYLGPEAGHTDEGHNRGWQWEPKQWVELAQWFIDKGLKIAVVGASYDRSFYERYVREGVQQAGQRWWDFIGQMEIGETLAFLREAKVLISYQCGLAIVSHYLGGKVVSWWRKDGDSAHSERMVSFDEEMRNAWVNPALKENYHGCLYKRESVEDIIKIIDEKGWVK